MGGAERAEIPRANDDIAVGALGGNAGARDGAPESDSVLTDYRRIVAVREHGSLGRAGGPTGERIFRESTSAARWQARVGYRAQVRRPAGVELRILGRDVADTSP